MSGKTELLPCPFCEGEARTIEPARYGKSWGVRCECGAFLGFEYTEAEAIAAWNTRAEHGTLTAEQVRETVEKHWHDLSAEYDMPEATALPEYSYDWQAIADELNAALGGGECEWTLKEEWLNRTGDDHVYGYETNCGARHTWWPDSLPNYCPKCGAKVRKAVEHG